MESLHQQMLQRYKTLIYEEVEIASQYKELDCTKSQIESEIEAAKKYLQTGFRDPSIKTQFQEITQLKKELASGELAKTTALTKTHVVIRILQQHGQQGLDANDILTLLPSYGAELDRNYLTTILGKLRKTGKAIKEGNKFFITSPGKNPTKSATAPAS